MYLLALLQTNKLFAATAALLPTAGVVAYGAFVSLGTGLPVPDPELQDYVSKSYRLSYADGQKAMFKTDYGASLVLVGSHLGPTGTVTKIAKNEHGWTVSTSKGYVFTVNR